MKTIVRTTLSDLKPTGLYILAGHEPRPARSIDEWITEFINKEARIVIQETMEDFHCVVSTVFLGVAGSEKTPLLFETMVFGGVLNQKRQRYATWDEAVKGHAAILEEVRNAKPLDTKEGRKEYIERLAVIAKERVDRLKQIENATLDVPGPDLGPQESFKLGIVAGAKIQTDAAAHEL